MRCTWVQVTLEMVTYVHIFLVNEDQDLYYAPLDMPAKARSSVVTDLGQVDFVFTDKTGTLTQNVMKFKRSSIDGVIYGAPVLDTPGNRNVTYANMSSLPSTASTSKNADLFLTILALCHTVVVEKEQQPQLQDDGVSPILLSPVRRLPT